MTEWIMCPKCGALMSCLTAGYICPLCGYRVPAQTITTTTGTSVEYYAPVIRCKDCKYCDGGIDEDDKPFLKCLSGRSYGGTNADDYCAWAERKKR